MMGRRRRGSSLKALSFVPRLFWGLVVLLTLAGCVAPDTYRPPWVTVHARFTPIPEPTISGKIANASLSHTATPLPVPRLSTFPWLLAYDSDAEENDEIYLLPADGGPAVNVTHHPAEDRYPAWSPDGQHLAFQSNRDGNWEIYTLALSDHRLTRLTFHLAYDGAPSWSPDGAWIAFESYRDTSPCQPATPMPKASACPDLEIYRVPANGGTPQRLTHSPGGDYQPVWSPSGDQIAFTSWRDGDKEIYVLPSHGGSERNVTANPGDDWFPSWSPDGQALVILSERDGATELDLHPLEGGPITRLISGDLPEERPSFWLDGSLLFARYDPGQAFEVHDPHYSGEYHLYRLSDASGLLRPALRKHPERSGGQDAIPQPLLSTTRARHPAAAPHADPAAALPAMLTTMTRAQVPGATVSLPTETPPSQLELKRLDEIQAPDPHLVSGVDAAFRAWRDAVSTRSGYDFLGRVSDIFRPAAYYGHRLGYLSWHKTGRAVDLLFDWHDDQGENALYTMREDLAGEVYWRLFLKCSLQDGTMGEPLTQAPWYFWWHFAPPGDPGAVANGGRRLPIPPGYFVDVTALAERYGWSRIASYHLDDFHWQRDSTATEYWHYQQTDGLTWYQAMSQIYSQELLQELFSRPVALARGQTEEILASKGLPPPHPLQKSYHQPPLFY